MARRFPVLRVACRPTLAAFACAAILSEGTDTDRSAAAQRVEPLRINGLVAAVFSPFEPATAAVNLSVVPAQQEYLRATGVDWVFVTGTTGESLSLTHQERKDLFDAWIATGANVIAHVGSESLLEAQDLARYAEKKGAKAIGCMPPVFFSPSDAQALALSISSVCAAAPTLPCYYYHIPSMTHYDKPMFDFVKAIEPLAPNFAGIKYTGLYTSPGYMDVARILAYKSGKYEVLSGREEMMLEGLVAGMKGHVGSQFNFAGDIYNELRLSFAKDSSQSKLNSLRNLQMRGIDLISAWEQAPGGTNGCKHFMNLAGVPVGPARLPSLPVDAAGAQTLKDAWKGWCGGVANKYELCSPLRASVEAINV